MSYTSGFFDAVDLGEGQYDRVYSSAEFAHFFGLFVGNGVFPSPSTGLSVVCNTPQDMTIKVSPGSGFINGHYLSVPEGGDEYLTLPIAHPSLPRIDSIIMGLDLGERQVTLYVKPGQAAAAPEPVALQRDDTIYELELARITLLAGAGSISQSDILDTRPDPDRCGLVTGLIDQFDVSGFFQAAYASFEEWFEGIKGQVDEDVAISLQLQVNELREQLNQDREKTLSAETKELMGLPPEATPSEAFLMLYESSGGAVRRNRPPLPTDAEEVGKLWVVPKMTFNNLMPGAITQATGNWRTSTATLTASGNSLTTVGNASSNQTRVEATLSKGVTPGDKIFVQLKVDVNHDANTMVAELVVGETVLATQSLEFPAAGNVLSFQALTTTEVSGTPVLKLYSTYNTAAVQSGKGFTVSNITVWNLTSDMCEAQEDNEFSEVEAANYLSTYGQFQSREYEFSTWWWILRGVTSGVYFWHRMYDYATATEAQGGTVDTKLMTPLRTQDFYTHRIATQNEVDVGTDDSKHVTPKKAHGLFTSKLASTAEAQAGSSDAKWMSPLKVLNFFNNKLATQSEAEAGSDNTKAMTPLRVKNFLTKNTASQTEVNTGTDTTKLVTPATAAGLFTNKLATTAEAQAGSVDTKWVSPLKIQQFFTSKLATQSEADTGTSTTKAMTPALVKRRTNPYISANIGDVMHTANNAELETNGAFIKVDGRDIDTRSGYPLLADTWELSYRIANPTAMTQSGVQYACDVYYWGTVVLSGNIFFLTQHAESNSYTASLCLRKSSGAVTRLLSKNARRLVECQGQVVCITTGDQQLKAVVYNSAGTQVRSVSLSTSTNYSPYVYVQGNRIFVYAEYNGSMVGYYTDDNFATFGTSTWGGSTTYSNSKYPLGGTYQGYLGGIQRDSSGTLYLLVRDNSSSSTPYIRAMRSTDLGKTWTVAWSYANTNADRQVQNGYFIHGSYLYTLGTYSETSGSNTYSRQCIIKLQLSNGSYVARTTYVYSSTGDGLYGFVQGNKAYLAGYYWSRVLNLDDMSHTSWVTSNGETIGMRPRAAAYLSSNGRFWLSVNEYTYYKPTYTTSSNNIYQGLLVYDTELHESVYITSGLITSTNNTNPYYGGFGEADGVIYFPRGKYSDSTYQSSAIVKLDTKIKKLPSLDYAYLKAKEVT